MGLSNANRQAGGGTDVRQVEGLQDLAYRPVLTGLPVHEWEHAPGRLGGERAEQAGVDVALLDVEPGVSKRLTHPAPGLERDLPLVREPSGEHDDTA